MQKVNTISFYPGPSKIDDKLPLYLAEACRIGILSANHRSKPFMELYQQTEALFKEKMNLPRGYHLYFVSSATECWQVIAQSYYGMSALHVFNGAFGEKWYQTAAKINPSVKPMYFSLNKTLSINKLAANILSDESLICITQNETSNGTQVSAGTLKHIRSRFPKSLIAIDATSSMGGIVLPWQAADIWYASVQKCFGLPSGLGLLILSEKARKKAIQLTHNQYYNSIINLISNRENWQTTHTPNVLNIYLLNQIVKNRPPIENISRALKKRAEYLYDFLHKNKYKILATNAHTHSKTVIAVKYNDISTLKENAQNAGIILGNGYGKWKENTFRIANFPAITDEEFNRLYAFLFQA
jgi:phosphoserine aminotransferase